MSCIYHKINPLHRLSYACLFCSPLKHVSPPIGTPKLNYQNPTTQTPYTFDQRPNTRANSKTLPRTEQLHKNTRLLSASLPKSSHSSSQSPRASITHQSLADRIALRSFGWSESQSENLIPVRCSCLVVEFANSFRGNVEHVAFFVDRVAVCYVELFLQLLGGPVAIHQPVEVQPSRQ